MVADVDQRFCDETCGAMRRRSCRASPARHRIERRHGMGGDRPVADRQRLLRSRSPGHRAAYADQCGVSVDVPLSSAWSSLNPGYWVVYGGPFDSSDAASAWCASTQRPGPRAIPAMCQTARQHEARTRDAGRAAAVRRAAGPPPACRRAAPLEVRPCCPPDGVSGWRCRYLRRACRCTSVRRRRSRPCPQRRTRRGCIGSGCWTSCRSWRSRCRRHNRQRTRACHPR